MTVKTAAVLTSAAGDGVQPVTSGDTEWTRRHVANTERLSANMRAAIPPNDESGSTDTKNESASGSPTSKPLVERARGSNRRWRQPRSVREFAAQVNAMATALLNGDVPPDALEPVRLYAGLARTVAQAMTTEVARARFLGQAPELTFDLDEAEAQSQGVEE